MVGSVRGGEAGRRALAPATGRVIVERLRVADTHWTRLRGLLGTRSLEAGDGLWITPCQQVHMLGMRYAIDAVFLDADGRVVRTIEQLGPGRISPRIGAAVSVLELPAGTAARAGLTPGALVQIEGAELPAVRGERAGGGLGAVAGNLAVATVYLLLALLQLVTWRRTGQWVVLGAFGQSVALALLFAARRPARRLSTRPQDWALGMLGLALPLLLPPGRASGALAPLGTALQLAALLLTTLAAGFLGRSIGIVAADRGLRTEGPYAAVRHPMYLGEMLRALGYLLAQPGGLGMTAALLTVLVGGGRAAVEERLLRDDAAYREYAARVRWRFVPYVY